LFTKAKKIGIVSWLFNIRHGKDLELYGEFCLKEGKPLFGYKFLSMTYKALIGFLVGWLVLLFIVSTID